MLSSQRKGFVGPNLRLKTTHLRLDQGPPRCPLWAKSRRERCNQQCPL